MEFRYAVETRDTDPAWFQRFVYGGPEPYDVEPGLSDTAEHLQVRVVTNRPVDPRLERWNGSMDSANCTRPATQEEIDAFDGVVPPVPRRTITLEELLDRITLAEHTAIETAMVTNPQMRAWWGQLIARREIHLDAPRLVQGLLYIKSLGVPTIWPDEATADERLAAIRADG